jgi:hypothetical protein
MFHASETPLLSRWVVQRTELPLRDPENERTPPHDQRKEPLMDPPLSWTSTTVL